MKKLLLRSFAIALVLAPCSAFTAYIVSLNNITEFRPPFSEPERRQMDNLPFEKVRALMAARAVKISRTQWLGESVGSAYFWHDLATRSITPFAAIFLGCVWLGALERRKSKV